MDFRSPTDRRTLALVGGVGVAGVAAYLAPHALTAGPVMCPFRRVTGLPCPGCGLTRSCVAFLHGDLSRSLHFHPFGPLVVAVIAVVLVRMVWPSFPRPPARVELVTKLAVGVAWAAWYPLRLLG